MSNWSEAVWIVRKLQKNFDFTQEISNYENKLYDLNIRINNLIDRVEQDENNLNNKVVTFISTETNGIPDTPPTSYGKGAIWLIIRK